MPPEGPLIFGSAPIENGCVQFHRGLVFHCCFGFGLPFPRVVKGPLFLYDLVCPGDVSIHEGVHTIVLVITIAIIVVVRN